MVRANEGDVSMTAHTRFPLGLAALAALALALLVAGCGRKGPLDPPPSAAVPAPVPGAQASGEPVVSPEATPRRKRVFLDWLID
jgi:predicted small lipoprotein YifL